ncbi:MAG: DNA-processing protein DprA [bacterium]
MQINSLLSGNLWEIYEIYSISMSDLYYPIPLENISTPPISIYCVGNIELLHSLNKSISIVGSRHPDKYGIEMTEYFSDIIAKNKITIISGLALGIDSISHRQALRNSSPTIAVIPGSFDNLYPKLHRGLALEIVKNGGLLISEYLCNKNVDKDSFKRRNRIIAGLSPCTLVTEALVRSGSLITARYAFDFDREVFAVPGNIDNKMSAGCNFLISEETNIAKLALSPEAIIQYMNWN